MKVEVADMKVLRAASVPTGQGRDTSDVIIAIHGVTP